MSTKGDQLIFEHAIASLQSGALDDAACGFSKFLQRHPKHFGALNLFGIVLVRQGRYSEAESALRRAIAVDGRSDTTFYNYGIALKALNRHADSLEAFTTATSINPTVPENWNNRGTAFNDLKRFGNAVLAFDRAIALRPDYAEAWLNKGGGVAGACD